LTERRRLLGKLEFIGTDFLGWQNQPQGPTIQSTLEAAISELIGYRIPILAPSRTDAGVHALGQLFCVDIPPEKDIQLKRLFFGINANLPMSISLKDLIQVPLKFNIRENIGKSYKYRIWQGPYPRAFFDWNHWWIKSPLDLEAMQEAANMLLGTHDFSGFRARGCQAPNRIKTMRTVDITECDQPDGKTYEFHIEGDHFLRKMIRIMVGSLVDVGWHRKPTSLIAELLETKVRSISGQTAPAKGLCLEEVFYQEDLFASRGLLGWEDDPAPKKPETPLF